MDEALLIEVAGLEGGAAAGGVGAGPGPAAGAAGAAEAARPGPLVVLALPPSAASGCTVSEVSMVAVEGELA